MEWWQLLLGLVVFYAVCILLPVYLAARKQLSMEAARAPLEEPAGFRTERYRRSSATHPAYIRSLIKRE